MGATASGAMTVAGSGCWKRYGLETLRRSPWKCRCRISPDERLCCLVVLGVRLDGKKELVALQDGYRESTENWAELLRDLKRRGMRAPVLAVGDGALGFWTAVREVFPESRHQRDWVHKTANVLDALPKSVHRRAKKAIWEITEAEDKTHAERAVEAFAEEFGSRWPKAAAKITEEKELLLAFYEFPAEHWRHLRTTNPIESTFAPVRARTDLTKGPGIQGSGSGDDLQVAGGSRREVEEDNRGTPGPFDQSGSEVR